MARPGRPSKYKDEYAEQARKLCQLGATNEEMAKFFDVAVSTVDKWIAENEQFSGAVKNGRAFADAEVANRLYRRAMGYSHPAVKIFADAKTGMEHQVEYTEHYAPDTVACIFWLKNRRPDLWRDRVDTVNTTTVRQVVTDKPLTADEWERQYSDSLGSAAGTSESTH